MAMPTTTAIAATTTKTRIPGRHGMRTDPSADQSVTGAVMADRSGSCGDGVWTSMARPDAMGAVDSATTVRSYYLRNRWCVASAGLGLPQLATAELAKRRVRAIDLALDASLDEQLVDEHGQDALGNVVV